MACAIARGERCNPDALVMSSDAPEISSGSGGGGGGGDDDAPDAPPNDASFAPIVVVSAGAR